MAEVKASVSIKEATDNCTTSENLLFTYDQTGPQIAGIVFEKGPKASTPDAPDAGAFRDIFVGWKPAP